MGALSGISVFDVEAVVNEIAGCISSGKRIWIFGNGGSASTASHFAVDLGVGNHRRGCGARANSLCDSVAVITATANDESFDLVYARSLRLLGTAGELAIAISVSGNSPNVVRGVAEAQVLGMRTIGLLAGDGGKLLRMVDFAVLVPCSNLDYGPAEDAHLAICHMITEAVRETLSQSIELT